MVAEKTLDAEMSPNKRFAAFWRRSAPGPSESSRSSFRFLRKLEASTSGKEHAQNGHSHRCNAFGRSILGGRCFDRRVR